MPETDADPTWFHYTLGFILAIAVLSFVALDATDAWSFNETFVIGLLVSMLLLVGMGPIIRRIIEAKYGS